MSRIPVVFTPDDSFIVPTCVAVCSMLESKKADTEYFFYFVIGFSFNIDNTRYIKKIETLYTCFRYEVIRIDDAIFKTLKINTKHLSISAFYRLFLGSILTSEEKVMYHDGDILVLDDLSKYYEMDIEGFYVGGVPSIYAAQNGLWRNERVKRWGFEHTDDYIFSGDMVINLTQIREDDIEREFAFHMGLGYPSEDQDVINRCCIGKIKKLPLGFCMLNRWVGNEVLDKFEVCPYSLSEIDFAKKNPSIIHFAGADAKPWKNRRVKYGDEWWRIAKRLLSENEYIWWIDNAEKYTLERDWIYYSDILNNNLSMYTENKQIRKVVVYGFGKAGREFYKSVLNNKYSVSAIIDSNAENISQEEISAPILSPVEAIHEYSNALIFVTVQGDFDKICDYLKRIGYKNAVFVQYVEKGEFYYQVIDDKYIAVEKEDILRRGNQA